MRKIPPVFLLLFMIFLQLNSQDLPATGDSNWQRFIHIEGGMIYPEGSIRENIAIRQNISSYYVDQVSNGHVYSETYGIVVGAKWEYFNQKLNIGFSSGLRYTDFQSEITGYSSNRADFFYLRYSMEDSDTKFARVKYLEESAGFITIPLEVRFIPFEYKNIGLFGRAGAEVSIMNILSERNIGFREETMEAFEDEVLGQIGNSPGKFYSSLYASIGLKMSKPGRPEYVIELFLPSPFLSKNNFVLTKVDYYSGFKFSIHFPILKSK
ncbi:MAG: hypothetical protein ACOCUP_02615 [bacterium]